MALKLDISKAYDKVEWFFLRHTTERLGFSNKWINLVMDCITTSSYSVIINRATKGLICPQRGLRQLVLDICRGVFKYVDAGRRKKVNSWTEI